jgi:hypothetical protein
MKYLEAVEILNKNPIYELSDALNVGISKKQFEKWDLEFFGEDGKINPTGNEGVPENFREGISDKKELTLEQSQEIYKREVLERNKKIKQPETPKDILKQELKKQEVENFVEGQVNWLDENFYDCWDKIKGHFYNIIKPSPNDKLDVSDIPKVEKWFFLAHQNNSIKGKPQLVESVMKTIPLIRLTSPIKKEKIINSDGKNENIEYRTAKYTFFDERYDKRYDGAQLDCFSKDFWIYKIETDDGKEIFIWSQEKLPNCTCTFRGMLIELDDFAELSRSLKIKSLSKVFFLKSFEPDIKILSKEQLILFTKEKNMTEIDWNIFLNFHKTGSVNLFDDDIMALRSAFILSGKFDGYPLHLAIMGTAGTKKSWGHLSTLDYKFSEVGNVIGGGNTRAKALVPSFKEKPADVGYFAKTERVGFIDEMCKMAEMELNKHQTSIQNLFGEWNDLLDNQKRLVGSGNNNSCEVEATGKFLFATNPISNKPTIYQHIGIIDPTTMSRILWMVQDEAETKFLRSVESVLRISPNTSPIIFKEPESSPHTYTSIHSIMGGIENRKKDKLLKNCWGDCCVCVGGNLDRSNFITLFDSCYSFVCEINQIEVQKLVQTTTALAKEPMKTSVWQPRAEHHITLLIDGLVKHRCLFKDYDATFTPKQEDYDLAERILVRMVKSWDTDMSPKEYRG